MPTSGGPCGRPTLFAAVQELNGGPGRVMRWEIQGTGGLIPCGDVLAGGSMDALPFAVAAVNENYIVVASRAGVLGIDPVEDRVLFNHSTTGLHPNDAFIVGDQRDEHLPVVAWSGLGASAELRGTIRQLEAYSPDGTVAESWTGSELVLGNATAITSSTHDISQALAMNANVYIAAEVDLFVDPGRVEPNLIGMVSNATMHTITSGRSVDGVKRLVWSITIRDATTGTAETGMAVSNDPWGGAELSFETVGSCGEVPCDPIHAVLDPTLEQAVFAICDGSTRELLRFDIGGGVCETWADAPSLGTGRLSYLTVLP